MGRKGNLVGRRGVIAGGLTFAAASLAPGRSLLAAAPARAAGRGAMYSPIVDLKQYRLLPGKRAVFERLFEQVIEEQEEAGAEVIGQFHDLDDPDKFVWLRGFRDMRARLRMLTAFYDGPVWEANREAVNAVLDDASNVLLLRTAYPRSGFFLDRSRRPPRGATELPPGLVVATICSFDAPVSGAFLDYFAHTLRPALERAGAAVLASFVTEESPNNFPRHAVREGEHVFVWFAMFADEADHRRFVAATEGAPGRDEPLGGGLKRWISGAPVILRLKPTPRSLVRS